MIASISLPVGVSSACSVIEVTRILRRLSIDLKATACSRLRMKREDFQAGIYGKGDSVSKASSSILRNCGRSATRPASASSMYSRTTR